MISVIVPVYNVSKYLNRCIDSIIKQSYSDLEIILVDDGSTDDSGNICDSLAGFDKRIKVIHQKNGGLSAARNTGIDNAKGEYLAFIDSDDYIHQQMIERLYENLQKAEADVSVCGFYWICEDEIVDKQNLTDVISVYEGRNIMSRLYEDNVNTVIAWNKLYKAEIFSDIRYQIGKIHEDEFIIHQILNKINRIVYSTNKLYYYIKHGNSITSSVNVKKYIDAIEALTIRKDFLKQHDYTDEYKLTQNSIDGMCFRYYKELKENGLENSENVCRFIKRIYRKSIKEQQKEGKLKFKRYLRCLFDSYCNW